MAKLIILSTFSDQRGNLTVIEKQLPFPIKRVFYIYGVDNSVRGGHRHYKTIQAAVCIHGSCRVNNFDGKNKESFLLDNPNKCLILETSDWHTMSNFSKEAVLLVFASELFDPKDYIFEPYDD
ncbi:MAG: FdtA/QdtA family cupin domain-containing protein [Bacteroidetes bacterium]|nr:FdtA/QdtA family cupin domain-containing protein [Bacteroidota bacterium]